MRWWYKAVMNVPETFYTVDVLFGMFVLLFGAAGLLRGMAAELARLITLVVLLAVYVFFFPQFAQVAAGRWQELPTIAVQAVTALMLLLCAFLFYVLIKLVVRRVLKEQIGLFFDRLLGALIGMLFGTLIGLSVFCSLSLIPSERVYSMLSERSAIGAWVCNHLTPWVYPRLLELPVFSDGQLEVPAE